jgi:NADPH2:quinone reductase
MKAWLLDKIGDGIDKLHLADVPDPVAAAGEVVLDVQYAALNPADRYLAEGLYPAKPSLPHTLGRDGMGVVRALGSGVSSIRPGQKVLLLRGPIGIDRPGMLAQRCAVPIDSLSAIPAGWSDEESAGAATVLLTAHQCYFQWTDLPNHAVVLVTGASGGVGVAAIQLGKALGHTMIGLSRDPAKSEKLRALGAQMTFDPNDSDWKKKLKEALGMRRVDLAIDNIGGQLFNDVIDTLGNLGRVSVVGRLAGPVPNFNTASLIFRRIRICGVQVGAPSNAETRTAWKQIVDLLAKTRVNPIIDSIHQFENLRDAFARLAAGPMGKVVVRIS